MMNILLNITAVIPTEMRMQQPFWILKECPPPLPPVVFRFSAYKPHMFTIDLIIID